MAFIDAFLPEFDHEMATTRRLLERVPEDRTAWKPHPRSWTLGELGLHLANLPQWAVIVLTQIEFDTNPTGSAPAVAPPVESAAVTLALFDQNVRSARARIAAAPDAELSVLWTLKTAGEPVLSMPREAVLRTFVMSHVIHHRGQLSVYLRLCDVPLPPIYGPTADNDA